MACTTCQGMSGEGLGEVRGQHAFICKHVQTLKLAEVHQVATSVNAAVFKLGL